MMVPRPAAGMLPPADQQDRSGGAVTVAYVHSNEVSYSWHHCMVEMIGYDMAREGRIIRGGYIAMRCGATGVPEARSKTVTEFLQSRDADWLLWIDTDMGFPADMCERLLEAADPAERPVVGALCFTQRETEPDGMGGWRCQAVPTIFDWARLESGREGFLVRWEYPRNTLIRCAGTGSAAILIHRSVFTAIKEKYGPVWYEMAPNPTTGQLIGEDLSFCARAGAAGFPVHVHTGVVTTHMKNLWLTEDNYLDQTALMQLMPPAAPARERCAVLVPTIGRPQNAAPLMESLAAAGTPLARVYAIASPGTPEAAAWQDAGAEVIEWDGPAPGTWAQRLNFGYQHTAEPWLLCAADDVRFHPGWLDQALAAAAGGMNVIGTNDLHNPRVLAGEHATHPMIRRSYIDEHGASWDGPKVLAHEGYRHWFTDDEIIAVAKQRGTFTAAPYAKVEHLHPLWGLAEDDAVYEAGREHAGQDRELFEMRVAEYGRKADGLILPDIGTAVTAQEATALARLAEGQTVLELGAYTGFSTVVLASVAERVWSVDWHGGDIHSGICESFDAYTANLARYGVQDRVEVCKGRFEDVVPELAARGVVTDGAFIDGQHDEESVARDLALALTVVKPGGWIAFHDYGRGPATGHPGFAVTAVADRLGVEGTAGHLAWGRVRQLAGHAGDAG